MKAIKYSMFSMDLGGYHCALPYANITLSVLTLVKRHGQIANHHSFSAKCIS